MKNFLLSLLLLGSVQARSTYLSGKDTRDTDESNGVSHLYTTTRDSVVEGRASDPISAQDDEDDIEFDRLFPDEANPPDFDNLDPTYPYSETDTWPADFDTWNDTTPADVSANFDPKVFAEEDPASLAAANRHPWYKVKVLTEFLLGIDQVSFEAVSAKDHLICGKVKNKILVPITSKWTFKCKKGKDHGWVRVWLHGPSITMRVHDTIGIPHGWATLHRKFSWKGDFQEWTCTDGSWGCSEGTYYLDVCPKDGIGWVKCGT